MNNYPIFPLFFREALEVLTIVNNISPMALNEVSKCKTFHRFVLEMILLCPTKALRIAAAEQFLLLSTYQPVSTLKSSSSEPSYSMLSYFLDLLFSVLNTTVPGYAKQSLEFFQLLCRLLNFATTSNSPLPSAEPLLLNEINWLYKARVSSCPCILLFRLFKLIT